MNSYQTIQKMNAGMTRWNTSGAVFGAGLRARAYAPAQSRTGNLGSFLIEGKLFDNMKT